MKNQLKSGRFLPLAAVAATGLRIRTRCIDANKARVFFLREYSIANFVKNVFWGQT